MTSKTALAIFIGLPCSAFLFFLLMCCLWNYREMVGLCLLALICLVVGVFVRGAITEQNLRIYRFNHHEETPLDMAGQPTVLRPDMREHPHRHNNNQPQPYEYGYQYQER